MSSAGVEKRGSAATVRACDSCRRRKRRCLWTPGAPSCSYCTQLKEDCTTTHIRKPRSKPQKKDRIAEYESRIKNLETLLKDRSEAQPHIEQQPLPPANEPIGLSTWMDNLRAEVDEFPENIPDVDPHSYDGPLQIVERQPFFAETSNSISGESVLQPPILQSFDDFEPSADFQHDAALLQDPFFEPTTSLTDVSLTDTSLVQEPGADCDAFLPDPELGASLLSEFLVDFNTFFPLYRPYAVAEHLRICYEGRSDKSAVAWASAYVVLGIAHRTRGMSTFGAPIDSQLADWYTVKILPTVSGLLTSPPTLGLVQCLVGLAILIRGSPNSTPHAMFISTALRIAQCLAYADKSGPCSDPDADVEQERRTFWLAYIMDTDENMLTSAPMTQRRGDLAGVIPEDDPDDSLGTVTAAEGTLKVNVFTLRIRLALLQAEAIEHVLSLGSKSSTHDITETAGSILKRLEAWHNNKLFQHEPRQLMQLLYRSDLLHVVGIEASYFATVFRIHAFLALGKDPRVNPFSADALITLASQTEHGAYKDAERLLGLLSTTPHEDIGICWMIKLPVFAAFVTVLAHYLHSPSEEPSQQNMHEYSRLLRTITLLADKAQDYALQHTRNLCAMQLMKLEKGLKAKQSQEQAEKGQTGSFRLAQTTNPST